MPTRRVGKIPQGNGTAVSAKVTTTPPHRRAASVFGTRGAEIVVYPVIKTTIAATDAITILEGPDTAREAGAFQERGRHDSLASVADNDLDVGAHPEGPSGRRIYVRFKDLAKDTGAAYIHVLMGLFADNPGDDDIALVFASKVDEVEIKTPNAVAYDEISEIVQDIVGEDAVIEIFQEGEDDASRST